VERSSADWFRAIGYFKVLANHFAALSVIVNDLSFLPPIHTHRFFDEVDALIFPLTLCSGS
jgi:hypothetical protein